MREQQQIDRIRIETRQRPERSGMSRRRFLLFMLIGMLGASAITCGITQFLNGDISFSDLLNMNGVSNNDPRVAPYTSEITSTSETTGNELARTEGYSSPVTFSNVPRQVPISQIAPATTDLTNYQLHPLTRMIAGKDGKLAEQDIITVLENAIQYDLNLPEGGFRMLSGAQMTINLRRLVGSPSNPSTEEVTINLPNQGGSHNYLVYLKGFNTDSNLPDGNQTIAVNNFVSGHALSMRYPSNPPGGYISAGQIQQHIRASLVAETDDVPLSEVMYQGTNCGASGCRTLHIVFFDVNTGAYIVEELRVDFDQDMIEFGLAAHNIGDRYID